MFLILWPISIGLFFWAGYKINDWFFYVVAFQIGATVGAALIMSFFEKKCIEKGLEFNTAQALWDRIVPPWMRS